MAVELNPLESARAEKERLVRNIENTKAHLKTLEDKLAAVGKTIDILAPAYEPVKENPALAVLDPVGVCASRNGGRMRSAFRSNPHIPHTNCHQK